VLALTCVTSARRGRLIYDGNVLGGERAMWLMPRQSLENSWLIPVCPMPSRVVSLACPDPHREELAVLVRTRKQLVDRHRRLLNEAEALLGELPTRLIERLPSGTGVAPKLTAGARLHVSGERLTDLRLQVLRLKAREHRLLVSECALLERQIAQVLKRIGTHLTELGGLGTLAAAETVVEVGDPRRFRSADAFASYTGTAPIPASSAETRGHPVHHRLSRFGNRRLNAVLYIMAVTRLRSDRETQAYVGRLLAAGKTKRDALRILKRRLARLVWMTMIRDLTSTP
jgi:transposase